MIFTAFSSLFSSDYFKNYFSLVNRFIIIIGHYLTQLDLTTKEKSKNKYLKL